MTASQLPVPSGLKMLMRVQEEEQAGVLPKPVTSMNAFQLINASLDLSAMFDRCPAPYWPCATSLVR